MYFFLHPLRCWSLVMPWGAMDLGWYCASVAWQPQTIVFTTVDLSCPIAFDRNYITNAQCDIHYMSPERTQTHSHVPMNSIRMAWAFPKMIGRKCCPFRNVYCSKTCKMVFVSCWIYIADKALISPHDCWSMVFPIRKFFDPGNAFRFLPDNGWARYSPYR